VIMTYEPLLDRMPTTRPATVRDDSGLGVRPRYAEEAAFKIHGGCGLMGICDESGELMSGVEAIKAMAVQRDRGNGLGGGYAGYGIYPEFPDHFCFHMMYHDIKAKEEAEAVFDQFFTIDLAEPMPTRAVKGISDAPLLWRYFLQPDPHKLENSEMTPEDFVVHTVMLINGSVDGAFVSSSGKNMGAFKGSVTTAFRLTRRAGGAARTLSRCLTGRSCTTARSRATASTAAISRRSATSARSAPTPRSPRTSST
jgi:hypothetical protein